MPYSCFILVLFLWLAVLAASGSRWSGGARQDEKLFLEGGSFEESREGGGRDATVLSYIVVYSLHLRQQSLVLRSPGQPPALTHAESLRILPGVFYYSFLCLERLFSCTVCDAIISVMKII